MIFDVDEVDIVDNLNYLIEASKILFQILLPNVITKIKQQIASNNLKHS
jgi:hypothetical protein